MHPTAKSFLLLVVVAAATSTSFTTHALAPRGPAGRAIGAGTSAACVPRERDALLEFKRGITSDPVGLLGSWQRGGGQDCCRWRGVRCSSRTGHVLELDLRNVDADDIHFIDDDETALAGQISPSLLSLQHLEYLDLSLNKLQGPTGLVPEFLGSLKNLRYLNLSGVPFSGRVPPQLGNLSKLHYLDLSSSSFIILSGGAQMNSIDISWLTHLPLLRYLNMASVDLSKVVDWAHVVNKIPSLRALHLANCFLESANQSLPHLNLTNLEELDLSGNYFDHPIASCWFWKVKGLKYLNLASTGLYGQFPRALGDLKSLQVLDLSSSTSGNLGIMTADMTNLCNLEILDLRYSNLRGNIIELLERLPQCSSNKLNELDLSDNNITGMLPNWIGQLASLITLDLSSNHLTGPVPSQIGVFNNLTYLDLSGSNLDGVITHEHFASLTSLKTIDLFGNSFKIMVDPEWLPPFRLESAYFAPCQMGPLFPHWLKWQVDILDLDISSAGITDALPYWFVSTFSKTIHLNISNNGISGSLPASLEVMTPLRTLYLNSNKLTGQIPQLPIHLTILDISRNSLSGPLPSNFGAPYIVDLRLFSNLITGHIPRSFCQLQNLDILDLADNLLEGEFPQCFEPRDARVLLLSNNRISGKFPSFLQRCTRLTILDLAWNKFSGRLPMWIGNFVNLEIVRLSHNMFSESIPATITNLTNLAHLNLADNSISGVLPRQFSNLTGMTGGHQHGRFVSILNMSVITKRQQRYYDDREIYDMVSIDLSSNYLTGEIPEDIASLDAVKNLNLSRNYLSGKIPHKVGSMQSLESLDLSRNKLYGEIPPSLSNLTYLSYLDLSYNNLTGRIPAGRQLDTLYMENPSMYNGNNGLCGLPLKKSCSDNSASKHGGQKGSERDSDRMFFYFGLGLGFVVGLWVVFCAILFKKAWRIAYFRLFDKVYDKVYVFVVVTWASLAGYTLSQLARLAR